MNKTHSLNIAFEDLFKLIIGLIVDDLKVHRHLHHLSLSGLDTTPLHLKLHTRIFVLAGFKERDISEELEDWYFEQTKRVQSIDLVQDEEVLYDLSSEILAGLLKLRNEVYARRVGTSG
ncbi:MAG: hypothetical protein K0S23_3665 [Fluviicola sp.]|jgi:hypothetical protein|uniref:hypothetical protein n=1 Tax=Fluviicola sp. TaxID=1917219 RepID=UPI00260E0C45|nr:hypothetical protein [Fluviicola sp.]MDF3029358.1 hypothetical protein [Fluviicola sp.]